MFGLGKERTPYGDFSDRYGVKQEDIVRVSGLSRNTVSYACSKRDFKPTRSTANLLVTAIRQLTGKSVDNGDFW
jgi:predicted transcriptional regulator